MPTIVEGAAAVAAHPHGDAVEALAREERSDEADAGGGAARGHPSSPTTGVDAYHVG